MSFKRTAIAFSVFTFLLYAILIISLFYFFRGKIFVDFLFSSRTLYSIAISLSTATISTIIAVFISIPSAYALSRFQFRGKKLVDIVLELPMIVSPAALGAMLLIFFYNPVGSWIQANLMSFVFTVYGIILAQFISIIGVSTRLIKSVIDEIPERYETVARTLGATHFKAFRTTTLKMSKNGIVASSILSWAKALGEFGATITIAGSMSYKTETLPTAIYMRLAQADIEGTVVLILTMIGLGLIGLSIVRIVTSKKQTGD